MEAITQDTALAKAIALHEITPWSVQEVKRKTAKTRDKKEIGNLKSIARWFRGELQGW